MADETTPANPQAGDAENINPPAKPQAGTPDPQAGDGSEAISLEAAKNLRSENANLRKRMKENDAQLAELKAFKDQIEAQNLTDTEKRDRAAQQRDQQIATLQKERDDFAQQVLDVKTDAAIQLHAFQQGIDPKLAQRLLDRNALEKDEAGNPTNLDAAFKAMIKEFNLNANKQQAPRTGGGATNPTSSQSTQQPLSHEYISKLSVSDWQSMTPERRREIQAWQMANPYKFSK